MISLQLFLSAFLHTTYCYIRSNRAEKNSLEKVV